MTVDGLNNNNYLSDNPIYVTISGLNSNTKYVEYTFISFEPSTINLSPVRFYTHNQTSITIDISPSIKASFKQIDHNTDYATLTPFQVLNNWLNISLVFKEVYQDNSENSLPAINKTFIKGGKRTYNSNQRTQINKPLIPSDTIPIWDGFPIDY